MELSTATPLSEAFARDWIARFMEAWNSHDPDRLAEMASEDVRWANPFIYPSGVLHGRTALCAWLASIWRAVPDLHFELEAEPMLSLDRRRLAGVWRGTGRMTGPLEPPGFRATGGELELFGVDLHSFAGERVAHVVTITDVQAAARQRHTEEDAL